MLIEEGIFVNVTKYIATGNVVSDLVVGWREVPLTLPAQSLSIDTSRDVDRLGKLGNGFKGSLDSVLRDADRGESLHPSLRPQV